VKDLYKENYILLKKETEEDYRKGWRGERGEKLSKHYIHI
jgi:hypothetical protein